MQANLISPGGRTLEFSRHCYIAPDHGSSGNSGFSYAFGIPQDTKLTNIKNIYLY
jgi:hypothetical protein